MDQITSTYKIARQDEDIAKLEREKKILTLRKEIEELRGAGEDTP